MNEARSFRKKGTSVIEKFGKLLRRCLHPNRAKNGPPTVTPICSRYTLNPHEPKHGQKRSPKVGGKLQRRTSSATPTQSRVPAQGGVKAQAAITQNAHSPHLHRNQPELVAPGYPNASERYIENLQRPPRLIESPSINLAIAAGAPVIITKDEAERQRLMRQIHQEDKDFIDRERGKFGQAKQSKGDKGKGKGKAKQTQTQKDQKEWSQLEKEIFGPDPVIAAKKEKKFRGGGRGRGGQGRREKKKIIA